MKRQAELIGLLTAGGLLALGLTVRAIVRMRRYISLENRTILITGGSRGLGLTLARLAAEQRANVAICAADQAELDRAKRDLSAHARRIFASPCDITAPEQVSELIQRVISQFGTIDMLINNTGIIQVVPKGEMTAGEYDDAIQTHFNGPLHAILGVLPLMRARGGGRIVNIASIDGKVAGTHLLPYTASKFALVGFSEGLRTELAKQNIFVTTVTPGLFRSSARPAFLGVKGQHRKEYAWFARADVLPGLSISPEHLARRILSAAKHGQAELITPLAASLQATLNDLMPGLVSEISAIINACLPLANGRGARRFTGVQSGTG